MAACFFNATHHSERHFELKNSEFRCEMKFWKSLHLPSEKTQNGRNLHSMFFQLYVPQKEKYKRIIWIFWFFSSRYHKWAKIQKQLCGTFSWKSTKSCVHYNVPILHHWIYAIYCIYPQIGADESTDNVNLYESDYQTTVLHPVFQSLCIP